MATETAKHQLTTNGSRSVSVRVTDEHWFHLTAQGHLRGLSIASVIREAIEQHLDSQPDLGHEDGGPGTSMSYRAMLGIVDFSQLEELQEDEGASS